MLPRLRLERFLFFFYSFSHSVSLILEFSPFTFKVIVDESGLMIAILLFVFLVFC